MLTNIYPVSSRQTNTEPEGKILHCKMLIQTLAAHIKSLCTAENRRKSENDRQTNERELCTLKPLRIICLNIQIKVTHICIYRT